MSAEKVAGIIPARYGSSRLPGKPLALIEGKPMIRRVFECARALRAPVGGVRGRWTTRGCATRCWPSGGAR
jgi:hypothetical protein